MRLTTMRFRRLADYRPEPVGTGATTRRRPTLVPPAAVATTRRRPTLHAPDREPSARPATVGVRAD